VLFSLSSFGRQDRLVYSFDVSLTIVYIHIALLRVVTDGILSGNLFYYLLMIYAVLSKLKYKDCSVAYLERRCCSFMKFNIYHP
jgi:hypothetical protein